MAQTTTTPQVNNQQRTNTMSILALIFAFVCWPLGITFGVIGRKQIARTGEEGAGLAKAGLILGIIFGVLTVLYVIVVIAFVINATHG